MNKIMAETAVSEAKEAETPEVIVEEAPKRAVAAEDGIEGLKKQLDAERIRREAAEKQAREAQVVAHKAAVERDDTNLQLVRARCKRHLCNRHNFQNQTSPTSISNALVLCKRGQ